MYKRKGLVAADELKNYTIFEDILLIVRGGRLFSVDLRNDKLEILDSVRAKGVRSKWREEHDEIAVVGKTVVLLRSDGGYDKTQIGLYEIDESGHLIFKALYHLRYAGKPLSRDHPIRTINGKLNFYASHSNERISRGNLESVLEIISGIVPRLGRIEDGDKYRDYKAIASSASVFKPATYLDLEDLAIHSLSSCSIENFELDCEAQIVLGPSNSSAHVSPTAAYFWAETPAYKGAEPRSFIYRLPIDGSEPSALAVKGTPVNQFSFSESNDMHLNVGLVHISVVPWVSNYERRQSRLSLLRIPISKFVTGNEDDERSRYHALPSSNMESLTVRFVGDHFLYASKTRNGLLRKKPTTVYSVNTQNGDVSSVTVSHKLESIEAMGREAVIVGFDNKKNLVFTSLDLGGSAKLAEEYVISKENVSRRFSYRSSNDIESDWGLQILNVNSGKNTSTSEQQDSIVYLDNKSLKETGSLSSRKDGRPHLAWHNSSRPIIYGDRFLVIMGEEIVEGEIIDGQLRQRRRISFPQELDE